MTGPRACWCGNAELEPFAPEYGYCAVCGTLVSLAPASPESLDVQDDAKDFYGREYWLSHQQRDLHTPDIADRARADLPERCLHWLRTLLTYRLPPGRVLELGAAHGAYVALMRWAGFDATGLELSPWVVDYARETFGVPMLHGRVETQPLAPGSIDVIVMNDVLEHLPDPQGTLRRCAELLVADGLLVVQMPCYEEPRTYAQMKKEQDRFLQHVDQMGTEHQHLFSQRASQRLLGELGFAYVNFEAPMFPYDMFLIASRQPLARHTTPEGLARLLASPSGRLVTALLDVDVERSGLKVDLLLANDDRARRLTNVQILEGLLKESDADRQQRLAHVHEITQMLHEANADREQRLAHMQELTRLLQESNADRAARLAQVQTLSEQMSAMRHRLEATTKQLDVTAQSVLELQQHTEHQSGELTHLREMIDRVRAFVQHPAYRALARFGIGRTPPARLDELGDADSTAGSPRLLAIDLTPILPGSENGGAKQLVLELLRGFATTGRHRYLLLTSAANDEFFAQYDALGMRRLCMTGEGAGRRSLVARVARLASRGLSLAGVKGRLASEGVDLLFCPMTDPIHAEPGIPTVSIVYDLQHVAYPSFFTPAEREHRVRFFERVARTADAAICISEFTRSTLVAETGIDETRALAIPIAVPERLAPASPSQVEAVRRTYHLDGAPYALYPANFWPHKNHRLLLVALAAFLKERPDSPLHIVLVGNALDQGGEIAEAIEAMQLSSRVHILGYVTDEELAALWTDAYCLLYPSLYEGFGIPVLEAMRFGTPVICSEVASLPEVGADAVLYIDPRKPGTIVSALTRLADTPGLRDELIARGRQRLEQFQPAEMVARYLAVFDRVLADGGQVQVARVEGVFGDRWLSPVAVATTGASKQDRRWDLEVLMPDWHPHQRTTIRVEVNGRPTQKLSVQRGRSQQLVVPVPRTGAHVRLNVSPSFVPGTDGDSRELTVMLTRVRLVDADSGTVAYEL